ncbi:cytidylyltransferase domain-containing protein [Streptomyces sp. NPDC020141]|uniref:cytidylyltransferase domain-containing protein n=1 Tax=Streptomyces sp. NPDC020141 TaxID=3365065 RepID=UPI0037B885CE
MTVLAVIPARGGSKGVPAKNLAPVGGAPLVVRAVRECLAARLVTDVVVSTDDPEIAAAARGAGAQVVSRPAAIAGDTATSEAAVLHALDAFESERGLRAGAVLLVQCTSPFLTRADVEGVAAAVVEDGADSAVTVAPFHGFLWRETAAPEGREAVSDDRQAAPDFGRAVSDDRQAAPDFGRAVSDDRQAAPDLGRAVSDDRQAAPDLGRAAPEGREAAPDHRPGTPDHSPAAPPPGDAGQAPARPAGRGVNHDPAHRPRRQDRPRDLLETGAAYAMDADGFRASRHRFFGRTALVTADPARVLEVDDPHDLDRARALAPLLDRPAAASRADEPDPAAARPARPARADVDAVVLDFDGTQTDDRVHIDADGRETVSVHRGDGLGIARLREAGLALLILSTERNPVVAARARKLRIPVLHGVDRKDLALARWCEERGVPPERVLYLGNDVNDLPCFSLAGWPVAVADAHPPVRAAARAVTAARGGRGAVREIAAWLLGPALDPLGPAPSGPPGEAPAPEPPHDH